MGLSTLLKATGLIVQSRVIASKKTTRGLSVFYMLALTSLHGLGFIVANRYCDLPLQLFYAANFILCGIYLLFLDTKVCRYQEVPLHTSGTVQILQATISRSMALTTTMFFFSGCFLAFFVSEVLKYYLYFSGACCLTVTDWMAAFIWIIATPVVPATVFIFWIGVMLVATNDQARSLQEAGIHNHAVSPTRLWCDLLIAIVFLIYGLINNIWPQVILSAVAVVAHTKVIKAYNKNKA